MLKQKLALDYYTQTFLQVFAAVSAIIVARIAGPEVLGILAFGLAFASMFSFISNFGLEVAHTKLVSSGEDLGKCNATFSVMKFISTGLFLLVSFSVFLAQKYLFHIDFESKTQEQVVLIFIFRVAILSLALIPLTTFAAKMEIAKKNIPTLLQGVGANVARIIIVLLGFGALAIALSNLIISIFGGIFLYYLFKHYPINKFDLNLAKKYWKIAPTVLWIGIILTITNYVDKVLLQYFTDSQEVGYYTAGYKIGSFIKLLGLCFGSVLFPLISGYLANKNYREVKNKIVKFGRFVHLFIMPMVIFCAIYSPMIIKIILGSKYLPSINVLSAISLATFVLLMAQPHAMVIFAGGFFKKFALCSFFNLVVLIMVEYFLVSKGHFNLGASGAALAVLVANLFSFIVFKTLAAKAIPQLKIPLNFRYILYGITNLVVFYIIYQYFSVSYGRILKIIFPVAYFLLTYASLYLLKLIERSDWAMLKGLVDIKSMRGYVRSELFDGNINS